MSQAGFDFGEPLAQAQAGPRPTVIDQFVGDHYFLSNFAASPVKMYGEEYPTVEHAYQASKTKDPVLREAIRKAWLPGIAKKMGRQVEVDPGWWGGRIEVMRLLVDRKFEIPDLRAQLDATGRAILIEGNWWHDTFWGVCNGVGTNWLGRILMSVRDRVPLESVYWRQQ